MITKDLYKPLSKMGGGFFYIGETYAFITRHIFFIERKYCHYL